jgi:hypothetical protein
MSVGHRHRRTPYLAQARVRRWILFAACGGGLRSTALPAQTSAPRTGDVSKHGWTVFGDVAGVWRSTWLSSNTAPTVEGDVGVSLGVGALRPLSARTHGGFAVRVQSQPLRLSEAGATWDGGTLTVGDAVGTLVFRGVRAGRVQSDVELSSGLSLLTGARRIYPFSSAGTITPVVGLGAVLFRAADREARAERRRLNIIVRYDLIRLDPGPTLAGSLDSFAGTAGWSPRVSAGLRVLR